MTMFSKFLPPRSLAAAFLALTMLLAPMALAQGVYPAPEAAPALTLRVTGTVEAIVPFSHEGVDGYAIGGNFDQINGSARRNLALVDADGALLAWTADADATVRALAVSGGSLYVGGDFSVIGGQARSFAAKVSLADGSVDAGFLPAPDGSVRALAIDASGDVFLGGAFASIGGAARDRTAKVDGATGALDAGWVPDYSGADSINALAYDPLSDRLYVGGSLKMVTGGGGHDRAIGRLSGTTGARDSGWRVRMHPKGGAQVWTIVVDSASGHVYFGGQFRRIGNTDNLGNLARVAESNAALDSSWTPSADAPVRVLAMDGTGLLAGGDFSEISGVARQRLARLQADGSVDPAFSANADRPVRTIAVAGGQAVLGGAFRFLGGDAEEGIARIDSATGARDASFAGAAGGPGKINAFAFEAGGGVIAGGEFDFVWQDGDPTTYSRANMLRLNPDFSLDTGWSAGVSGDVQAVAISGSTLHIGGSFLQVTDPGSGTPAARLRLAAYDISLATPSLTGWNPSSNGDVTELVADPAGIYAGGLFTTIGGAARAFAARLDAGTGLAHAWNPASDGPVHAIVPSGTDVFLGGDFSAAGGAARDSLALVDNANGTDTGMLVAGADSVVRALALDGSTLYVGGSFSMLQGVSVAGIARIDLTGGSVDPTWSPSVGGAVRALALDGGWLYFGGGFSSAGGVAHPNLARASLADAAGGVDPAWRPGTDGPVAQLAAIAGGDLLVGGDFANVTGVARGGAAVLGPDGSDLTQVSIDSIAPSPSVAGDDWTVSFTVTNTSNGAVVPTGSVTVTTDAGEACAAAVVLDAAGQGSCIINSTVAGTRTVTVSFEADGPELMDSSAEAGHEVQAAAVDPGNVLTTIEATDAAATADGVDTGAVRVTLTDEYGNGVSGVAVALAGTGSAVLASASGATDANGEFSTTLTNTVAETVTVTAQYDSSGLGTPDAAVSGSAEVVFSAGAVDPDPEVGSLLEATDDTAVADGSDTAEVRITLTDAFGNPVEGVAVELSTTGTAVLGTTAGVTGADGRLTATLTSSTIETVEVSAQYDASGDGTVDTVAAGSPVQVSFVAEVIATTTTITSHAPDPSVVGQDYLVGFTVDASAPATGTVLVSDGSGATCNATLVAGDNGAGSCTLTSTSAGARTLTASFAGSGSFGDSVSDGVSHTVDQAATALSLMASASIVAEGDTVTFSWSLDVVAPGAGAPGGTVTVSEPGGLSCSASVAAGSCGITIAAAGNYDFTGSYGGDADFLGDSDGPVFVDVQAGGAGFADLVVRHEIVASGILSDGSGDLVDYELEVSNAGGTDADMVDIDMLMPAQFQDIDWTCSATGAASCGIGSGTSDIAITADIPAGDSVLISLSVRIVDPDDEGVETAAFAGTTDPELDLDNNSGTTFYRSCSGSELLVVGGFTTLPAHVCGFRDGFEARGE